MTSGDRLPVTRSNAISDRISDERVFGLLPALLAFDATRIEFGKDVSNGDVLHAVKEHSTTVPNKKRSTNI